MIQVLKLKNWEIFLTLFLIPFLIHLNLPYLTHNIVPTAIFLLIWAWIISIWLFKLADYLKTDYVGKYEVKLLIISLISLNLFFIIAIIISTLLLYNKDLPILENGIELLSKIDDYVRLYIYLAYITIFVIESRIVTAKRLKRKLSIQDYYKSAISFFFLPIGIFWIQNEINKLYGSEDTQKKNRKYIFIGVTILMVIATIVNFNENELFLIIGNKN
jgi:flagellar basal body-associated protein FliL